MASSRKVLVTGATGKQGGAVINALLASPAASSFQILAVTRNPESGSAKALVSKSPNIKIVKGDLEDCEGIFREAGEGIDSAFLVTLPDFQKTEQIREEKQGKDFVDAAVANGVKHFVFASLDRGAKSDTDPTYVPHFISKHNIELHLKEKAASSGMTYVILRPVAFLDNFQPDFFGKMFATLLYQMGETRLQLVSVKDIGIVAVMALTHPEGFKNRAISLAGDDLNYKDAVEVYRQVYGRQLPTTFSFVATFIRWMATDLGLMVKWFEDVGFAADIEELTRTNKGNDRNHTGLADGTAGPEDHLPRYFAKSGHVDQDPKKIKKEGGGNRNWGRSGDEVQDLNFKFANQRRRSNSSTQALGDFKTKFETMEHDPDYDESLHGPLYEDPDDMNLEKADSLDSGSTLAGSVDEEELKK